MLRWVWILWLMKTFMCIGALHLYAMNYMLLSHYVWIIYVFCENHVSIITLEILLELGGTVASFPLQVMLIHHKLLKKNGCVLKQLKHQDPWLQNSQVLVQIRCSSHVVHAVPTSDLTQEIGRASGMDSSSSSCANQKQASVLSRNRQEVHLNKKPNSNDMTCIDLHGLAAVCHANELSSTPHRRRHHLFLAQPWGSRKTQASLGVEQKMHTMWAVSSVSRII